MIVLDEQLQGEGLEEAIGKWYPGAVQSILDLRPDTLIKDEAIPAILARNRSPTFITINVSDFWLKVPADGRYCVVCFFLTTSQVPLITDLLRRLFRHSAFDTKAKRMGKVARITQSGSVSFYDVADDTVREVGVI